VKKFRSLSICKKIIKWSSNLGPTTLLYGHGQVLVISSYFSTIPGGQADAGYINIKASLSPVELNLSLVELGNLKVL
jgi:hypothetical protein